MVKDAVKTESKDAVTLPELEKAELNSIIKDSTAAGQISPADSLRALQILTSLVAGEPKK